MLASPAPCCRKMRGALVLHFFFFWLLELFRSPRALFNVHHKCSCLLLYLCLASPVLSFRVVVSPRLKNYRGLASATQPEEDHESSMWHTYLEFLAKAVQGEIRSGSGRREFRDVPACLRGATIIYTLYSNAGMAGIASCMQSRAK